MATVYASAPLVVARMVGKSQAMDDAAGRILQSVRHVAEESRNTGAYIHNLSVVTVPGLKGNGRMVDDRLVVADDPGAAAIEWGHLYRYPNQRRVKFIPGKHIMRRGLGAVMTV